MKKLTLTAALLSAFAISAQAQEETTPEQFQSDAASHNEALAPVKTNREKIEDEFDAFAKAKGITYGTPDMNGAVYFRKYTRVEANVDNPRFIQSRALAYEKAYQDALTEYVMDQFGRHMIESQREYVSDDSDYQMDKPVPKDAQNRIWKKTVALAEAKLNAALQREGVDPALYAGKPEAEKRVLFRDAILKKSIKRASGSTAGIVPVQTFEARDPKGNYAVGVILRAGPSVKEIAAALKRKQLPASMLLRSGGKSVQDVLPDGEAMVNDFGVRLFFNEKGLPSLISFGQFGVGYTGSNERELERKTDAALGQAQALADSAITAFINSSISALEENIGGESAEKIRHMAEIGDFTETDVTKVVARIVNTSSLKGEDTMKGRGTVYNKVLKHPSGHLVAVVVRQWNYDLAGVKTEAPKPADAAPAKPKDDGVKVGTDFDF